MTGDEGLDCRLVRFRESDARSIAERLADGHRLELRPDHLAGTCQRLLVGGEVDLDHLIRLQRSRRQQLTSARRQIQKARRVAVDLDEYFCGEGMSRCKANGFP